MKNPLFFLEFVLFDALAVAWGVYELWSVRRSTRADKAAEEAKASPEDPGHSEG